jgi:hypothetical protein
VYTNMATVQIKGRDLSFGLVTVTDETLSLWLHSPFGPWPLFQFLNLYRVGRTPWTGDQPVARPLPTHRINTHKHTCLEWEFDHTFPVFERAKTVRAVDGAATVIGRPQSKASKAVPVTGREGP